MQQMVVTHKSFPADRMGDLGVAWSSRGETGAGDARIEGHGSIEVLVADIDPHPADGVRVG